jgi:hypothetical protein
VAALNAVVNLQPDTLARVGQFRLRSGARVELFTGRRAGRNQDCLVSRDNQGGSASCGSDLFQGRLLTVLETTSGGTEDSPAQYQLAGLARPPVARVVAIDSAGDSVEQILGPDRSFVFEVPSENLAEGISVAEVLGYDHAGSLVSRIRL